jgi:hypothetical protein
MWDRGLPSHEGLLNLASSVILNLENLNLVALTRCKQALVDAKFEKARFTVGFDDGISRPRH